MSMPNISDINPNINIVRDDAVNLIMTSIAMEELALAHILNAEGEKLQYVLGTLEGRDPGEVTICDVMEANDSVHRTLRDVIKEEMLLQLKLEDAIELAENASECQLSIRGRKIWRDNNNAELTRPDFVEIVLKRDGEDYKTATVDSTGDGTYTFTCLPVWKDSETKYTYQVDEEIVPEGYIKTVIGYNIINILAVTINGTKTWANDTDDDRPETIEIILFQNSTEVERKTIDKPETGDISQFEFANLHRYDENGEEYLYTVDEVIVEDYDKDVNGYDITNTFNP